MSNILYNEAVENNRQTAKYFKNAELTRLYGVSDKAIRNWIEKAQAGNVALDLCLEGGRVFIADTFHNNTVLNQLAEKGKKYRNRRTLKEATPTPAFYDLYEEGQVIDIINQLEKYRETPVQYRYLGKGANYWDAYLRKINETPNSYLTSTIELLEQDYGYLAPLVTNYDRINVIDIGVGNGMAARGLLSRLHHSGKLERYIGVDISKTLLDKTESNIHQWLNGEVKVEKIVKDISFDRFAGEFISNDSGGGSTLNLFLFLGGTLTNFREPDQPLKTIRDSMCSGDILVSTLRIDSEKSRSFFDYDIPGDRSLLAFHDRYTLDLLGIDRSFYNIERLFDERLGSRFIRVRLKSDVSINFATKTVKKRVELKKGEAIILIRMWHFTETEVFSLYEKSGLKFIRASKSHDQEFMLTVTSPKTNAS